MTSAVLLTQYNTSLSAIKLTNTIRGESYYKQLQVKTNRNSHYKQLEVKIAKTGTAYALGAPGFIPAF
jgi:hypothetical protein